MCLILGMGFSLCASKTWLLACARFFFPARPPDGPAPYYRPVDLGCPIPLDSVAPARLIIASAVRSVSPELTLFSAVVEPGILVRPTSGRYQRRQGRGHSRWQS